MRRRRSRREPCAVRCRGRRTRSRNRTGEGRNAGTARVAARVAPWRSRPPIRFRRRGEAPAAGAAQSRRGIPRSPGRPAGRRRIPRSGRGLRHAAEPWSPLVHVAQTPARVAGTRDRRIDAVPRGPSARLRACRAAIWPPWPTCTGRSQQRSADDTPESETDRPLDHVAVTAPSAVHVSRSPDRSGECTTTRTLPLRLLRLRHQAQLPDRCATTLPDMPTAVDVEPSPTLRTGERPGPRLRGPTVARPVEQRLAMNTPRATESIRCTAHLALHRPRPSQRHQEQSAHVRRKCSLSHQCHCQC
jgi:hypothetical protein